MLFLFLAVLSSALIAVIMRFSETKNVNRMAMLSVNYAVCALSALILTPAGALFPRQNGLSPAIFMGVITGVLYLANFLLLQWNIRKNGVVLSSTFMKLGILVPTLMAITLFGEAPSIAQILGLMLAVAAILIMNLAPGQRFTGAAGMLIVLLLTSGVTDSMAKVYEQFGAPALQNHYLLYAFIISFLCCALLAAFKRVPITWRDVGFGVILGVPNYMSAYFMLLSLKDLPAVLAYPVCSVGTILLVALAGALVFKERLSRRQLAALGVILCALVLLNI